MLKRLDALVGTWEVTAHLDGRTMAGGRTTFAWLEDKFLIQHTDGGPVEGGDQGWAEHSPFPVTCVYGLDETEHRFYQLYSDARDVQRVYKMTLEERVMTLWREVPGFHQRFIGTFSADGSAVDGAWEMSEDGDDWRLDFGVIYRRVR